MVSPDRDASRSQIPLLDYLQQHAGMATYSISQSTRACEAQMLRGTIASSRYDDDHRRGRTKRQNEHRPFDFEKSPYPEQTNAGTRAGDSIRCEEAARQAIMAISILANNVQLRRPRLCKPENFH